MPQSKGRWIDGLLGKDEDGDEDEDDVEEFLQPYIVSNPFEVRELTYNAMDGWKDGWIDGWIDGNSWCEVIHTSAR